MKSVARSGPAHGVWTVRRASQRAPQARPARRRLNEPRWLQTSVTCAAEKMMYCYPNELHLFHFRLSNCLAAIVWLFFRPFFMSPRRSMTFFFWFSLFALVIASEERIARCSPDILTHNMRANVNRIRLERRRSHAGRETHVSIWVMERRTTPWNSFWTGNGETNPFRMRFHGACDQRSTWFSSRCSSRLIDDFSEWFFRHLLTTFSLRRTNTADN